MGIKCCDRVLVLRAQSGESNAFNALVHKYRDRIMKLSLRYTRNRADAEDAVQNTFLKAYKGLPSFRGDAAFYSWLHRIAVNSAKTISSRRRRDTRMFSSDAWSNDGAIGIAVMPKDLNTPEDLAVTDEMCEALNGVMEALCEEQRIALTLREFHGLTYSQVASAMCCPVGTVRSRVFRAREAVDGRLRGIFDDDLGRARRTLPARAPPAPKAGCFA